MEPFSIACTTCRARLKVRDDSAIGQILSCPKCGSMVMVERPATPLSDSQPMESSSSSLSGIVPPASPSKVPHRRFGASPNADTVSGTYEDLDSLFEVPVTKKPVTQKSAAPDSVPTKPSAAPAVKSVAPDVAHSAAMNSAAIPASTSKKRPLSGPAIAAQRQTEPTQGISTQGSASAVTTTAPVSSPTARMETANAGDATLNAVEPQLLTERGLGLSTFRAILKKLPSRSLPQLLRNRQVMLVGGAGVFGILLAVGFVSLLASWTRPAAEPTLANTETTGKETSSNQQDKPPLPPVADLNNTPSVPDNTNEPPNKNSEKPVLNANEPKKGFEEKPAPPPAVVNIGPPKVPSNMPEVEQKVAGPIPEPAAVPPLEENKNPAGGVLPDNDPLAKFAELFAPARPAAEPTPDPLPSKPATPPTSGGEAAVPPVPRPAPRHVDVAAQLAYKIQEIEFTNTSLVNFLHFMSEMSTIPLTIDCDAIVAKKLSVTMPVTLKLRGTTVGATISEALKPAKLAIVPVDGQAIVTFAPAAEKDYRELTRKIGGLSGGDLERAEEIGRLISDFVAPESWNTADGNATWKATTDSLIIRHSEAIHYQVAYFCDKLRVARGLAPSNYDLDAMKPNSLASRAKAKLNKPVTLNFSRPDRLTKILERLSRVAECQIVVDWQAVSDAGWNPDGNTTLVVENKPLAEVLYGMLTPMDLAFRVIDDNLLQVSTPATIGSKLECEFYPVADLIAAGSDARQLVARLQTAVGDQHFREFGGLGLVRFDASSNCLIVSLPQPQHREVSRLLKEWKSNKPQ